MKILSFAMMPVAACVFLSASHAVAVPAAALDLLQLPSENRRMALQNLPDDQFKKLTELAFTEKESMHLRWKALVSLAEASPEKAWPFIEKAAAHKSWFMRNAALVAASQTHPLKAQSMARKLLKDKALVVRSAAVEVFQKFLDDENRDLLWEELEQSYNFRNTESLWIRAQIVQVLAEKPLDRERSIFARLLSDKDERVHAASIKGLEKLTGVHLGSENSSPKTLLGLWQNYMQKEKSF